MISWENFQNFNANKNLAFEDITRMIFKKKYLNDVNYNLNSAPNNPGIEAEPVVYNGKYIGYQAKFFENSIDYKDIKDSILKAHNNYPCLEKIILFCNKSIGTKSKSYNNNIKQIADSCNIEIGLCCNENILDYIVNSYTTLINIFFTGKFIDKGSLEIINENKLKLVGEKYFKNNHIPTLNETKLDAFVCDLSFFAKLRLETLKFIAELNKLMYQIDNPSYNENQNQIYKKVSLYFGSFCNKTKICSFSNKKEFLNIKLEYICAWNNVEKYLKEKDFDIKNNKNENFNDDIYNLIDYYKFYGEKFMPYYDYIISNIIIIEGDAGTGKTHLLSRIVDNHKDSNNLYFFIIGNKVINTSNPSDSLVNYFGLNNTSFFELLDAYEAYCGSKGINAFVIFDAINEVNHYSEWNKYISELLIRFENYRNIKIVLSIRTSFIDSIFDDVILKKIRNNEIIKIRHKGFTSPREINQFMKYYGIKYDWQDNNIWLHNPLYLKMYCEVNQGLTNNKIEKNPLQVFKFFIEKEEKRIRLEKEMNPNISVSMSIISKISKAMFDSNANFISYSDFPVLFGSGTDELIIAQEFVKNEVLISTMNEGNEIVSFCYQKIYDNSIIKFILDNYKEYDKIVNLLKYKFTSTNINEEFYGVLSQLFVKFRIENNKELLNDIYSICNDSQKKKLSYAYIESMSDYPKIISYNLFFDIMFGYGIDSFETLFGILINNVENDDFDIMPLHQILIKKEMSEIDKYWTININNSFYYGRDVFEYFEKVRSFDVITKNKSKQLLILTWLLSSTCRDLRDRTTKILAKNLVDDYQNIIYLIKLFNNVQDMYIKERLYGAIYGAILNSHYNPNFKKDSKLICNLIYRNVFCRIEYNVNILLRDYCANIIYELSRRYKFYFNNRKIYPRYKDKEQIVDIPISKIKEMYGLDKDKYGSGLAIIFHSMCPDFTFEDGVGYMYGDFGRYVFELKLSNFYSKHIFNRNNKIDEHLGKIFKYAYYIIISKFRYDSDYFSDYDKNVRSSYMDRSTHPIERIGKKYEWLAMYYLLALITSKYDYSEKYTDFQTDRYYGTWRPHIRDIDPTFLVEKIDRVYDLGISLNEEEFNLWNINDNNWFADNANSFSYINSACIKDSNNDEWICLYRSKNYSNVDNFDSKNQSLWSELSCCLIRKNEKKMFIEELKDISFYGRWANASEGESSYSVFLKEFHNSRAYNYEFDSRFESLEINKGYKKNVQTVPTFEDKQFKYAKQEVSTPVYTKSKKIKSSYVNYSWESLEDFSITDNVSVNMPIKDIADFLEISMNNTGIWYNKSNELVCADFRFVLNSNEDGLYIKRKYLDLYLKKKKLDIIWVCLGEKIQREGYDVTGFNELSSLVYLDDNGNFQSINHSNCR